MEQTADGLLGRRGQEAYLIKDDPSVIEFFAKHKDDAPADYVHAICANRSLWGEDLSQLPDFVAEAAAALTVIESEGAVALMKNV